MWLKLLIISIILSLGRCKNNTNTHKLFDSSKIIETLFTNILLPNISDNSCYSDIYVTFQAIKRKELWALEMLDSSAKIQSGYLKGNIFNLGLYSECMSVVGDISSNHQIKGKYCLTKQTITWVKIPSLSNDIPRQLFEILDTNNGVPIFNAVCVPRSCSADDLNNLLGLIKIKNLIFRFSDLFCVPEKNFYDTSNLDIFAICLFSTIFMFMIISTMYDLYLQKLGKKPHYELFISFSLYTNLKKLYHISEKTNDQLPCINGLKAISIIWICIGHRYYVLAVFPNVNTLYIVETWMKSYSSAVVMAAQFGVDTFFLLSGLLIIYVVSLANEKGFKLNVFQFYILRIFRLTPAFAVLILYYLTLMRFTSNGPLWPAMYHTMADDCKNNWWYSLIYIQNYVHPSHICISHSWYLGTDTQLYFLAPVLILLLQRWPEKTFKYCGFAIAIFCIAQFLPAWIREVSARPSFVDIPFRILLNSLYYRITPWLIGAMTGYLIFTNRGKEIVIKKYIIITLWFLSLFSICFIILIHKYFLSNEYNRTAASIFYGFSKVFWSLSVSWVIFACTYGYGGFVNTILSMKIFVIIGRLTYCIYLIHVPWYFMTFNGEINKNFSNANNLYMFLADFIIIVFFAHIWTLAFETPVITIGKYLIPKETMRKIMEMKQPKENTEKHVHVNNSNFTTKL